VEIEPPTLEAYSELLKNENLIMTPHIGGNTVDNQINSGFKAATTMIAVLKGEQVANRVV